MNEDHARKAIAYINLVLAEYSQSLWPSDERTLIAAVSVLNGLVK